jgi:AraC-like DNA-binding protein
MIEQDFEHWVKSAEKAGYQVAYLAKHFGICRKQLERWTKCQFGQSPQEWMDDQRLNKAFELLKQDNSLKEVASKTGFKQFSHFSRKFRVYYGVSPKHFVNWLKSEQNSILAERHHIKEC